MNIDALERDKDTKAKAAKDLFDAQSKACEADNRVRTDEEKAAVDTLMVEAQGIKAKIERAKGDHAMSAEIDRLLGGGRQPKTVSSPATGEQRGARRSMGQQFIAAESVMEVLQRHQRSGHRGRFSTGFVDLMGLVTSDAGSPGSAGDLILEDIRPGVLPLLYPELRVADLFAQGTTNGNAIVYMEETVFTNNADTVAEGALKPESDLKFGKRTETVHKIAHYIKASDEILQDVPQMRSIIDTRLREGVLRVEDDKLLNGAASPEEINGLLNRTGFQTAEVTGGSPGDSTADAIFIQMSRIFNNSYIRPTGIVMNPANWYPIQLMKNSSGDYMGGNPFQTAPVARLWGLPVVLTPTIAAGTALVGAFGTAAQLFRNGGLRVEATNSDGDDFIHNIVTIRAEERIALVVYRPAAFGLVTGLD